MSVYYCWIRDIYLIPEMARAIRGSYQTAAETTKISFAERSDFIYLCVHSAETGKNIHC